MITPRAGITVSILLFVLSACAPVAEPISSGPVIDSPTVQEPAVPAETEALNEDLLPEFEYDEVAVVTWVIDGDTIDVEINGVEYRVRYIGINTPERDEVCYQEATTANRNLVPEGTTVYLVKDISETDRYDRLLRYIYVETESGFLFVNEELVDEGWAESARYEPDTLYADYFSALEDDAQINGRGCHPTGIFD